MLMRKALLEFAEGVADEESGGRVALVDEYARDRMEEARQVLRDLGQERVEESVPKESAASRRRQI